MPTFPFGSSSISRGLIAVLVAAIGAWAIGGGVGRVGAVQVNGDDAAVESNAEEPGATPVSEVPTTPSAEPEIPPDDVASAPSGIPSLRIDLGPCTPKATAQAGIQRGDAADYSCQSLITVGAAQGVPSGPALAWAVTLSEITPGWAAALRPDPTADWNGQSASGILSPGIQAADVLVATIDLRVTAPTMTQCGDPLTPIITLIPSVAPIVDGVPGEVVWGEATQPVLLALTPAAPAVSLAGVNAGDAATAPPTFSHFDQVIDAGLLTVTVTSAACAGWSVMLGRTGGASSEEMPLTLSLEPDQTDLPDLALPVVELNAVPQTIVMSAGMTVPPGSYNFVYRITVTIPGGTPPGTYNATLAVSVPASP